LLSCAPHRVLSSGSPSARTNHPGFSIAPHDRTQSCHTQSISLWPPSAGVPPGPTLFLQLLFLSPAVPGHGTVPVPIGGEQWFKKNKISPIFVFQSFKKILEMDFFSDVSGRIFGLYSKRR
jgi:hypothetical protein